MMLRKVFHQIIKIIPDSIRIKMHLVQQDEYENGVRIQLNLGHTFGHAIESLSNYKIHHGHAVAIGIMMASRYSIEQKICSTKTADRIEDLFNKFDIGLLCNFTEKEIWTAMKHDKKSIQGHLRLILPCKIGEVKVVTV